MYLGLVQAYSNEVTAFYFKHFAFDKQPLGNNMFNNMLPLLCKNQALSTRLATVLE